MTRILLFIAFFCAVLFGISCSGTGTGGDASSANSTPPQIQYPDATTALAEGNRLLDSNMTEQAINAYKQAVAFDPDLAEAYFKLGIAYSLVEAEQKGKLSADPQLPGEQTKKEPKTESEKAFEHAIEAYKKWTAANPNDDVAQFNLARSYNKLNQDAEAEKAFRQAVKLKPDDGEYQTQFGAIMIKLAKYREAIDPLKKALDIDPDNSEAQELLDDAEAGRARIDYVPSKNDNRSANTNANANVSASNANSGSKPEAPANKPAANDKKNPPETRPKVIRTPAPGTH